MARMWTRYVVIGALALSLGIVAGCSDDDDINQPRNELSQYDSEVVTEWNSLFLAITKTERLTPPVASRAFAYEGVALYEAVVPGLGTHQSLAGQLNGLGALPQATPGAGYHWPTVANAALATVSRLLYAEASSPSLQSIDALEESFEAEFAPAAGTAVFERSVERGTEVGEAVYNWAYADGFAQYNNCAYVVPEGTGLWEPTPPAFAAPLQPCWGQLRDFVLERPSDCMPVGPIPYDEHPQSPFFAQAKQVYDVSKALTEEQRQIGLFWADGGGTITPPGHWISILNQVTTDEELTLDVTAEAYAKLGVAVGEAFITCWRTKFVHNQVRPISCLRLIFESAWTPLITTPPFPDYPSGHSTQSGAAAQVLTDMFGHMPFTDHTNDATMASRSFSSFFDAADEAAISRLYGGIHYRMSNEDGLLAGICVGHKVSALQFER